MRVLVTGGAGFIGSHLVDALLEKGEEAAVFDNFSYGKEENIKKHFENPNFTLTNGDLRNWRDVLEAMDGVDAVIHEGAIVSAPFSLKYPELTHDVNVNGTINILMAATAKNVGNVVFASSCAVYGNPSIIPIPESAPTNPLTPYAESKLLAERECQKFSKEAGLRVTILRYFNVYGPRQVSGEYSGVMIKFKERISRGEPPIIYGNGSQTRDFIYVGDVVEATLAAISKAPGGIINIGTGVQTSVNRLCEIFSQISGKMNLKPIFSQPRPGDILHSCAEIRKARKLLDFRPRTTIQEGVRKVLES